MSSTPFAREGSIQPVGRGRPEPHISGLYCYPVKGCAPVALTESALLNAGLEHDRTFMVVGEDGDHRTQRKHPRLALIEPAISAGGRRLVLSADGRGSVLIDVDTAGERRAVRLFGVGYQGIDQGDAVAAWLSDVLGVASRLVRVPPEHDRVTDGDTPGTSCYADSCPVHLVSSASLDELNRRLVTRGSSALPMSRFRPNVVVSGWDRPHVEDAVRKLRIGEAELGYAKPAIRCVVTTVDQDRGTKTGPEPLRTLATYRRAREGGIAFGVKFAVTATGRLAVGDPVTVDAWDASETCGRSATAHEGAAHHR